MQQQTRAGGSRGSLAQPEYFKQCRHRRKEHHRTCSFYYRGSCGTFRYQQVCIYGTFWYQRNGLDRVKGKKAVITTDPAESGQLEPSVRERVRKAGFAEFCKRGFSGASTLEIATRAKVSKRDLYALFAANARCWPRASRSAPPACASRSN
jgi:hypothetical protein